MTSLLRIDASARTKDSHSRALADAVEAEWLKAHPEGEVIVRDLASQPVAYINDAAINGFYTPPEAMTEELRQATALSDELIEELMSVDTLLISTPMYNFSVPAVLKGWIDQIVRMNRTFGLDNENGLYGLIKDKQAYIATALGAQFTGTPLEAHDHLRPFLASMLGLIGFEQIEIFSVESTTVDEQQMNLNRQAALRLISESFSPQGVAVS